MILRRRGYLFEAAGLVFKEVGDSPLTYKRAAGVKRIVLCNTKVTDPPGPHDTYFARKEVWRKFSKRGYKRLKKPVLDEIIPGVDENCIVAFLDYHQVGSNYYYVDYMKTRRGMERKGYATALADYFYKKFGRAHSTIHWGKMMRVEVGHIMEKMKKKYPKVDTIGAVNW